MLGSCEVDGDVSSGTGATRELLDADIERIESAYQRVRPSSADRCTSGAAVITLEVSVDSRPEPELLLADDDHSGCALPHLDGRRFVSGLDQLLAVLGSIGARPR